MSTVAGSLEIQLLTGMAQLRSDMAEAKSVVTGAMADITRAVKEVQVVLGTLGLTATVAGLYELAKGAVEGAAQMYHLSEMTGVAVESLSGLRAAAKLSNTDMETVAKAIQKLSVNMVGAQGGTGKAAETFRALGIQVTDSSGKLKGVDQVMLEVAKSQKNFSEGAALNAAMATLFGQRIGTQLIPLLNELADKGTIAGKVTSEQAQQAHEFERQLAQLKATTDGVVRSLTLDLLPVLMKLPGLFKVALEAVAAYFAIFAAAPAIMAVATEAFGIYAERVYAGETMIGALVPATNATILTIGPTWTAMAAKFGIFQTAVMTGLGVIAAAFIGWQIGDWLRENFLEAQLAGVAFVDGMMTGWETLKYGAKVAWANIQEAAAQAFAGIGSFFATVLEKIGAGLQAIGKTDAANSLLGFAQNLRTASDRTGILDKQLAGLKTEYDNNVKSVHGITDAMADEAIAHFNAGKAAEQHGKGEVAHAAAATQAYQSIEKELEKYMAETAQQMEYIGRTFPDSAKKYAQTLSAIQVALKNHNVTTAEATRLIQLLNQATADRQRLENVDEMSKVALAQSQQTRALADTNAQLQLQSTLVTAGSEQRALANDQLKIQQGFEVEIAKIAKDNLLSAAQKALAIDTAEANTEQAQQNALLQAAVATRQKIVDATDAQARSLAATSEQLQLEASLLGATDDERQRALEHLRIEQQLTEQIRQINLGIWKSVEDKNKAIEDAKANAAMSEQISEAKIGLQDQIDLTRQLQDEGKTLWDDLRGNGHDTLKKLGADIKTFLWDELYQLVAKKWIINVAAQVTGSSVGQSALSLASGGSNLGSSASSIAGLFNAAPGGTVDSVMGMFGAGSGTALTSTAATAETIAATGDATSAALLDAGASAEEAATASEALTATMTETSGAMAGLTSTLAAIPVYGWVALAAIAAYEIFGGKGGGPKDESASGALARSGVDSTNASQLANTIQQSYSSIAGNLGVTNTQLQNLGVEVEKDPQGTAMTGLQIQGGSYQRSNMYGGNFENVGRSDADLTQAIALASAQLLLKNLQEQVSGPVGDYLKSIDITTASLETMSHALQVATDVGNFDQAVKALGPTFANLTSLTIDQKEAMLTAMGGVQGFTSELAQFYNDFTTDAQKHDDLLQSLTATYAAANLALPTTRDEFAAAMKAALAAGNADTVKTLLSTEQAFNQLYPAIQSTADAAATAAQQWAEGQQQFSALKAKIASDTLRAAVDKAQQDYNATLTAQAGALDSTVQSLRTFAQTLKDMSDQLDSSAQGGLTDSQRYAAAKAALAGANASNVQDLVKTFLDLVPDQASSRFAQLQDVDYAKSILAKLGGQATAQASSLEASINASNMAAQLVAQAKLGLAQLNQSTYAEAYANPVAQAAAQAAKGAQYDQFFQNLFTQSGMTANAFQQWAQQNLNVSLDMGALPSYDVGTWNVPEAGPAFLHPGEAVIPASMNPFLGGQGDDEVAQLLRTGNAMLAAIAGHSNRSANAGEKTQIDLHSVVEGEQNFHTVAA